MNQDIKYSENPSGKCSQSGWFTITENIKGKWERNITSMQVSKQNTKFGTVLRRVNLDYLGN